MSEWLERLDPRPGKILAAEITRNERILAAKCLREDFDGCWYAEDFRDRILDCIGGDDVDGPANMHASLADDLADLIDPTCEIMRPVSFDKVGVCSACGALVNMRDSVANATNCLKPLYCPNCGARVVGR